MRRLIPVILCLLVLCGCTANKYLQDGEYYYEGASAKLTSDEKILSGDKKETIEDINGVFNDATNLKILGSRPRVWFYHLAGDVEKEKGFKHWMKNKLGEEPVLLSDIDLNRKQELVSNRLESNGFFSHNVLTEVDTGKHSASVLYTGEVEKPYRIDSLNDFGPDSTEFVQTLNETNEKSVLVPDLRYDFEKLQEERLRLETDLRTKGYYFFDDKFVLFEADTTETPSKIHLYKTIKEDMPAQAGRVYTINRVNVYADHEWSVGDSSVNSKVLDTVVIDKVNYIRQRNNFRPEVIVRNITIRPGQKYNREFELTTLNRMIQLDAFRYVNLTYNEVGDDMLNANVYLSPLKKKSIRVTLEAVTTSDNFVGPHLTATFLNRNFLKGAERYELNLTFGYEWQFGGGTAQRLSNYEVGLENVLTVPRLIQPFNIKYENSRYIPETKFKLGGRFQRRVGFYQLNSVNANYGFEWKVTSTRRHSFYPVVIKYIDLANTTPEFDSLLMENPFLARSFEEQFVLGASYSFFFSSLESDRNKDNRHNFYVNGNIDVSGNLFYLTQKSLNASPNGENGNYTILNKPYSQFVRGSIDFRHYWRIDQKNKLVSRFMTGVGYSYGNSITMPYSYLFATGGSSSNRAFRARSIGPGSYEANIEDNTFFDQAADIKLEMNVEYRFDILGAFKGALYIDASNIWTLREDPNRPGGKFEFGNVFKELAIGTGFGLRYDFQFFVIRFDTGLPLKLPYTPLDENGDPEPYKFDPLDGEWWNRYFVFNIAIGYPF